MAFLKKRRLVLCRKTEKGGRGTMAKLGREGGRDQLQPGRTQQRNNPLLHIQVDTTLIAVDQHAAGAPSTPSEPATRWTKRKKKKKKQTIIVGFGCVIDHAPPNR